MQTARCGRALGLPVDLGTVAADLDLLDGSVAIEAWRWTGEVAADFAIREWLDRAAERADRLARNAGDLLSWGDDVVGCADHVPGRNGLPGRDPRLVGERA